MAVLTWRNVDAPSARGSTAIDGLATAAGLINRGTGGLADAIGQFGQQQTALANNAAVAAASRYQDADALKSALADGSLFAGLSGVDPSKVDARTIGAIDGRVGTLLENAGTGIRNQTLSQNLHDDQYKQSRLEQTNDLLDAAKPAAAALALASQNRDPKAMAAAAADPSLARLPADVFMKLMQDATGLEQGRATLTGTDLSNQGAGIRNQESAFDFTNKQRDDRDRQAALAAADQLSHVADPTEALTKYNQLAPLMSAGASAQVRQQLEQRFGPIFGGVSGVAASLPGSKVGAALGAAAGGAGLTGLGGAPNDTGVAGTQNGGMYNVTYQYKKTDQPITTMSIDDLTRDGGLQEKMQKEQGASPIGAYQINRDTLKDYSKRLGLPATQTFTPEVQDQIGKAIFDDRKNGDITKTWAALAKVPGADKPGAFKNVSWDQMKNLITQHEGTAVAQNNQDTKDNVTQLLSQAGQVGNLLQNRVDANNRDGVTKAIAAGAGVTSDPSTEAQRLIDTVPAFKGAKVKDVALQIQGVMNRSGNLNERAAATLLANSVGDEPGFFRRNIGKVAHALNFDRNQLDFPEALPSGLAVDPNAIDAKIQASQGPGAVLQYNQNQRIAQLQSQMQAATADLQQKASDLYTARQRAAADPSYTGLARYEAAYKQSKTVLELLRASAVNDSSVNFPQAPKPKS